MALPTHDEMLAKVDVRFRELAPTAPPHLDPNDPSHTAMIQQWHQAHHEVLSTLTNEAYFSHFRTPRLRLIRRSRARTIHRVLERHRRSDRRALPGDTTGRTRLSRSRMRAHRPRRKRSRCRSRTVRCDSKQNIVLLCTRATPFVEAVAAPPLAAKLIDHTWQQVEAARTGD